MNAEIINNIEQLPNFPETARKIEVLYHDANSTLSDMAEAIKMDPMITANVLKMANSPIYGLSRTISDVKHAISLLGKDTIRAFVIASSAESCVNINLEPYGMTQEKYLLRTQMQNALVSNWVIRENRSYLGNLSLASLLMELGKVIISKYLLDKSEADFLAKSLVEGLSIEEAEINICGATSEEITSELFNRWNFNLDLVELIRNINHPDDAKDPKIAHMAKFLKIAKETIDVDGTITETSLQKAYALLEKYELGKTHFDKVVKELMEPAA